MEKIGLYAKKITGVPEFETGPYMWLELQEDSLLVQDKSDLVNPISYSIPYSQIAYVSKVKEKTGKRDIGRAIQVSFLIYSIIFAMSFFVLYFIWPGNYTDFLSAVKDSFIVVIIGFIMHSLWGKNKGTILKTREYALDIAYLNGETKNIFTALFKESSEKAFLGFKEQLNKKLLTVTRSSEAMALGEEIRKEGSLDI